MSQCHHHMMVYSCTDVVITHCPRVTIVYLPCHIILTNHKTDFFLCVVDIVKERHFFCIGKSCLLWLVRTSFRKSLGNVSIVLFGFTVLQVKMSLMAKLFGGGKKNKAPTPQEGIQRLREVEEMLMKKSDYLEKKIETELATAKKYGTKNKRCKYALVIIFGALRCVTVTRRDGPV